MESVLKYEVKIFSRDKSLLVNTLSPSGEYFFRIKNHKEFHWGLFCCPIAFFNTSNELIYHKQNQFAQIGLTLSKPNEIVSWSRSGSMVYFIERNSVDTCWRVLLDLKLKEVCRIECENSDDDLFETIGEGDFDESIIRANQFLEFRKFVPEKIEFNLLEFFRIFSWRPQR